MTIKNPEEVVSGRGNRKVAHKVFGNKLLRVIYENDDEITVVSAYRAEPKRYLRR